MLFGKRTAFSSDPTLRQLLRIRNVITYSTRQYPYPFCLEIKTKKQPSRLIIKIIFLKTKAAKTLFLNSRFAIKSIAQMSVLPRKSFLFLAKQKAKHFFARFFCLFFIMFWIVHTSLVWLKCYFKVFFKGRFYALCHLFIIVHGEVFAHKPYTIFCATWA